MGFWKELQRRHVFKVSAAYAVVAWLLVQVADVVLPAFEVPAWVFRTFLVLIAVGFLIAAVLSWLYDVTPQGVVRTEAEGDAPRGRGLSPERRLDFAVIALLGLAVAVLLLKDYLMAPTESVAEQPRRSLAVLAFANRSADPDDEYFADGLADELLTALSRLREFRVAPRTASFYFKGKDVDTKEIASILNVDTVLSGSVQRIADRLRVTVALDGAREDTVLWSESYDRRVDDLLDIQSEIALAVASAITPVLSPESRSTLADPPTQDPVAYDFYLRGLEYARRPTDFSTIASAEQLFDRAIELDPRFAEAHSGRCNLLLGKYEFTREASAFQAAEAACHRSLTLDDRSWEVRLALGNLYRVSGQYDKAIDEFEVGLSLQPENVSLLLAMGRTYASAGRLELADDAYRRAEAQDRGYWLVHNEYGIFLAQSERMDEALTRFRRLIELTPDSSMGYDNLGNAYLSMGRLDEARQTFGNSPQPSRWTYENLGLVNYYLGDFKAAIANHERALNLAPDNFIEWGNLGDAHRFVAGNEVSALNAYRRAIELAEQTLAINPDDAHTRARLSTYLAYAGETERAAQIVRTLLEESGSELHDLSGTIAYYAGRTRMHLGNIESAYALLGHAIASGWSRSLVLSDPDLIATVGDERFERL